MKEEWYSILFAGGMTGLTALVGGWDTAFQVFVICVALDLGTGVIKGLSLKRFSSKRMRKGFATKFGYIIVVVLATQFDRLMPDELPLIRTLVVYFYIAVEGSSILENLAQIGVPIPKVITEKLAVIRGRSGEDSD